MFFNSDKTTVNILKFQTFEIFSGTHSSCRASGLKLLLVLNQVVLVLTFDAVNETKS